MIHPTAAFVLVALAAAPTASPRGPVVRSLQNVEFTAPAGWAVKHPDGPEGFVTLSKGNAQIAVTFYPSKPGKWTVESLMQAQDAGARSALAEVVPTDKKTFQAPGGPAAFWVYGLRDGSAGPPSPFTGCVILGHGGVGLMGVAPDRETLAIAEAVIRSVRAVGI